MKELCTTDICFLSSNTTSYIHPLHAGIIAQVKTKIKSWLLRRVFGNIECRQKFIYSVDVLVAVSWVSIKQFDMRTATVYNCFFHRSSQSCVGTVEEMDADLTGVFHVREDVL